MFGISEGAPERGYKPSARSLLSYFNRNQPAAYNTPFKYFDNQKTWDIQVHNAFLLGLDWEKAAKWQQLKDQKNALDALKQAIKTGAVDGELASLGELEAERLQLSIRLEKERAALSNFQVLPQYREIEAQANALTEEIHGLVNTNITEKRRLERYQDAVAGEDAPTAPSGTRRQAKGSIWLKPNYHGHKWAKKYLQRFRNILVAKMSRKSASRKLLIPLQRASGE